jgi:hypothetical protein
MECRAIARRTPFGSVTVLGDLAQGATPWAARSWDTVLRHLGEPDTAVVPLTTGFRVPQAVMTPANRLLARREVDVPPVRSLRAAARCGSGRPRRAVCSTRSWTPYGRRWAARGRSGSSRRTRTWPG